MLSSASQVKWGAGQWFLFFVVSLLFSTNLPVAALQRHCGGHLGEFASIESFESLGQLLDGRQVFRNPHLLYPREAKCEEGRVSCSELGHPEICCPAPPDSVCQATNNSLTGVFCCSSPDPETETCDDTNLTCRMGSYACPAKFNGGCCKFGQSCALTACLNDGKGPTNEDELAEYYKGNGEDTPEGDGNPGLNEEDVNSWINDGTRLGDNESKDLAGIRTTFVKEVYTSTVVEEETTYQITITTTRAMLTAPTLTYNNTYAPTSTVIEEGLGTQAKPKAPSTEFDMIIAVGIALIGHALG